MKRRGRTLVIIILLAVLANIALSGLCAVRAANAPASTRRARSETVEAKSLRSLGWTPEPGRIEIESIFLEGLVWEGIGFTWVNLDGRVRSNQFGGTVPWSECDRLVTGWPWPAMLGERWSWDSAGWRYRSAIPLPMHNRHYEPGMLPLRPIWPGFAVNTLIYAAVLWLLIFSRFALRRFIRQRRGLCPACAYPRGESHVCSECGKPLPGRTVTT